MTDEHRARLHRISMAGVDLKFVYEWLGRSMALFTARLWSTRPDERERFVAEHRAARARAEGAAQAIEDEARQVTGGFSEDGPDKWSVDLDRENHERNKEK